MVSCIRNSAHIRGHATRKPYLTDEYRPRKVCCGCFQETGKQLVRGKDDEMRRNLGAFVCSNPRYPKRLKCYATAMNRDCQGVVNIALMGFDN